MSEFSEKMTQAFDIVDPYASDDVLNLLAGVAGYIDDNPGVVESMDREELVYAAAAANWSGPDEGQEFVADAMEQIDAFEAAARWRAALIEMEADD